MRSEGFSFYFGGLGVEACSLEAALPSATVRNRPQPFATVCRPARRRLYGRTYSDCCKKSLYTLHCTNSTNSTLYTAHSTLHPAHSPCHTVHSTLHISRFTLRTFHSILHTLFTLRTLHFTRFTPHFTLDTLHSTLYTSHTLDSALYTPLFILHASHYTHCHSVRDRWTMFFAKSPPIYSKIDAIQLPNISQRPKQGSFWLVILADDIHSIYNSTLYNLALDFGGWIDLGGIEPCLAINFFPVVSTQINPVNRNSTRNMKHMWNHQPSMNSMNNPFFTNSKHL